MFCASDAQGTFVYNSLTGVIRWIDTSEGRVQEITKDDLKRISAMSGSAGSNPNPGGMVQYEEAMAEARKQAAKALEGLEGQERAMAEKYLEQTFGGASKQASMPPGMAHRTYEKAGPGKSFNGRTCTPYVVKEGEMTVGELCTATLSDLKLSKGEFSIIGKLRDFMEEGLEGAPFMAEALAGFNRLDPSSEDFIGFPIHEIENENGRERVTTLLSIETGPVDPGVFKAGEGLKKMSLMP
jgi:hypothetical protein